MSKEGNNRPKDVEEEYHKKLSFNVGREVCTILANIASPQGYSTIDALLCLVYAVLIRYEGAEKSPSIELAFAEADTHEPEAIDNGRNASEVEGYSPVYLPCGVNGQLPDLLKSLRLELDKSPIAHAKYCRNSRNAFVAFNLPRDINKINTLSKYAITLAMALGSPCDCACTLRYDHRCRDDLLEQFRDHFLLLLLQIPDLQNSNPNFLSVPMLTCSEQQTLLQFNNTTENYKRSECLMHELFEEKTRHYPNSVAVACADQSLTYKELEYRSTMLSKKILSVMGNDYSSRVIGVSVDASLEMVIGLYAIMKAGFAYLPLDPSYPEERLSYMIENSEASLILAKTSMVVILKKYCNSVLCLDDILSERGDAFDYDTPEVKPDDLAYIIYTSGSTGRPKGVMTSHRNAVNTILDINERYSVTARDKILLVASLSFDLSVYDIFGMLATGGTVVIPVPEVRGIPDPACWVTTMKNHNVTMWDSAPAVLSLLMEYLYSEGDMLPSTLRLAILSGDRIPLALPSQLRTMVPGIQVMSQGGATEGSIWSIYYPIKDINPLWTSIPYGMPLTNQKYYVLDEFLNPVPMQVIGELYIGGMGVAMGYVNNPQVTKFRFLPSPFIKGERIYKTGDLGRFHPEGYIEFCGRIDNQVKIRGFRVELSEIESTLVSQEGVLDALVLKVQEKLVAYVIHEQNAQLDVSDLQAQIGTVLPSYMIPAFIIVMDSFPVTANGKVDRKSLPTIDSRSTLEKQNLNIQTSKELSSTHTHFTPRELVLANIWSEMFKVPVEKIFPDSSFFEVGGDSISAMTVVSAARKKNLLLSVQQVLGHPSLGQLAMTAKPLRFCNRIKDKERLAASPFVQLTPAQIWFFEQRFKTPNFWNQSFLLKPKTTVDEQQLRKALSQLISNHEMLRCTYSENADGSWTQRINEAHCTSFVAKKLDSCDVLDTEIGILKYSLNILTGPLLAVGLFSIGAMQRIFITVHHLVVDLVSWRIILEDLERLYNGQDTESVSMSFQNWSLILREYAQNQKLSDNVWPIPKETIPLITDFTDIISPTARSRRVVVEEMGEKVTTDLISAANDAFRTNTTDFLLASLILAYNETMGKKQLQVDVEAHGREPWDDSIDISRTVGWFMTMFPLQLEVCRGSSSEITMERTLKYTKENIRSIPKRGMPFWLLKLIKTSQAPTVPKSDVLFNYYGRFDQIQTKSAFWDIADDYPCGEDEFDINENLTHKIVVECFLKDGKLRMKMFFCTDVHRQSTIQSWIARWKANLSNLVLHCTKGDVFGYTPSDFPLLKLSQNHLDDVLSTRLAQIDLQAEHVSDMYPCTPVQEGFLFSLLQDSSAYLIQRSCTIDGYLDDDKLQRSISKVILRHDILRTRFIIDRLNGCMQIVRKTFEPQWIVEDLSDLTGAQQVEKESQFLHYDRHSGFDFSEPMLRFALFKHSKSKHRLIMTSHHSIVDGLTCFNVLQEVLLAYNDGVLLKSPQFREYVEEVVDFKQRSYKAEGFWTEEMHKLPQLGNLRFLPPESPRKGNAVIHFTITNATMHQLHEYAEGHDISVVSILCASWAIVVNKYSCDPNDVLFGFVVSGRGTSHIEDVNRLMGVTINTLPMRVKIHDHHVFEWLKYIQEKLTTILAHEKSFMTDIMKWCGLSADHKLFETVMSYNTINREKTSALTSSQFRVSDVYDHEFTEYPLTLDILNNGNVIKIKAIFDTSIIDGTGLKNALRHFERAMAWIASSSKETLLSEFDIVSPQEHLTLEKFNPSDEYQKRLGHIKGVHHLFENTVSSLSNAGQLALVKENASITYNELNAAANSIAYQLRNLGLKREEKVALILDREMTLAAGMLGIWKAGGAFVSIDASQPPDRIAFLLEDCSCRFAINASSFNTQTLPNDIKYVSLRSADLIAHVKQGRPNPDIANESGDLAYMIYTSGTTGLPKGAMVEHRGLINFIMYKPGGIFNITPETKVMQYFAVGFDGTVGEVFTTLCHGGCLVFPSGDFTTTMKQVDAVGNTPSTLNILNPNDYSNLKVVLAAGEACSQAMVKAWGKDRILLNGYGPTECSVISHTGRLLPHKRVTVGKPLPNTKSFILDSNLHPVPVNVTAELFIAGVNVGKGYHNRPDLTEKAFIENPFGAGRMYKTGDLARWLENGEIEVLGRMDDQIKLRGKRVELDEVRTAIEQQPGINQVHVTVQDGQYIVAYVLTSTNITSSDVISRLKRQLPSFMVPTTVFCLERFPLTANRKIDQRALPKFEPKTTHYKGKQPSNYLESIVLDAFRKVVDPGFNMEDDFFDLGGHSLLAISLKSLLAETSGVEVSMADIMSLSTPAELSAEMCHRILVPQVRSKVHTFIPKTCPFDDNSVITAKASYRQDQMCLLYELIPHSPVYNVVVILNFHGALHVDILKESLNDVSTMNQAFRTYFKRSEDNEFFQIVKPANDCSLEFDFQDFIGQHESKRKAKEYLYLKASLPFNLYSCPLLRFALVKLSDSDHQLGMFMHHSVTDGASVKIIVDQLSECYSSRLNNTQLKLSPQKLNYIDYSNWERKMLDCKEMERQLGFWKQQLQNVSNVLDLPLDRPRPAIPSYQGATVFIDIPDRVTQKLVTCALECGATLFSALATMFSLLMRIYSQSDDVVIGAFFSGRHNAGTENIVGYFVNTLPLRVQFERKASFHSMLTKVKDLMIGVLENQDIPFQKILESLNVPRDTSYHPIIQAATVLQEDLSSRQFADGLSMEAQVFEQFTAKFDLNLEFLRQSSGKLSGHFVFNTDIFNRSTIERMSQHLVYLFELLTTNMETPMCQLDLLPPSQTELIKTFNKTGDYSKLRIHQQFEQQVELTPDLIAVEEMERQITYRRLNAASNSLARKLKVLGAVPDSAVGLIGERNLEFIASKIGILKSGAAFVCIEATLPQDRIHFMLDDAECKIVVTTAKIQATGILKNFNGEIIVLDVEKYTARFSDDQFDQSEYQNLKNIAESQHLAWIVYTSGTTGKPKGVMVNHWGCECLIPQTCKAHDIRRGMRITHFFNIMFDAAYQEVFMALTTGATLVQRELNYVNTLKKVDFAMMTPSVLASLDPDDFSNLKKISVAGEILSESVAAKWKNHAELYNEYGPSEITIICTIGLTNTKSRVTVGKPVINCQVHILDDNLKPVPIGVKGTMFLGGHGVARGYLKRPDLTYQKFIKNPFGEGRLYNTGDWGSWTPDGEIIVFGRKDRQVKLRAFRVELDEVDHAMRMQDGIKNAAAVVNNGVLVGYVTPDIGGAGVFHLKKKLENKLPKYMVPSVIVPLSEFPMSTAEKIDYKSLPAPNLTQHEVLTKKEELLIEIWSEVLQIDPSKIKSSDSFFYLGGDSISAMKVFSLGRKRNLRFTVQHVFQTRNLTQLATVAKFVHSNMPTNTVKNIEISGNVPLTPVQEWFFHLKLRNRDCFNQSLLLRPLLMIEPDILQNAIKSLVLHHDILRASFTVCDDGKVIQEIQPVSKTPIPKLIHKDVLEDQVAVEITKLQNSLDLKSGPLMAVGLFDIEGNCQYIFITIHHMAVDLVSWQIILEDLETLCRGGVLPQKTTSFKEWSEFLKSDYALSVSAKDWPALEKSSPLKVDFLDYNRDQVTCQTRTLEKICFDESTTNQLLSLKGTHSSEHTSVSDVLLTALITAYNECMGESSLSVEMEWHGRESWTDKLDFSRTVGWFTVMYPVTLVVDGRTHDTLKQLEGIKRRLRNIPQKGMPYGVMKFLKKDSDPRFNQQCDVVFNYHGSATQFSSKNSLWEVCADGDYNYNNQCKDERISHNLAIECDISNGCLQGTFLFSKALHRRETIQLLADGWKTATENIVKCLKLDSTQISSDNLSLASNFALIDATLKAASIKVKDVEDIYSCTPLQEGFIFSLLRDKSSYLVQYCLHISGRLDIERFRSAWGKVIDHHSALRTSFVIDAENHSLRQVVRRNANPDWEVGVWEHPHEQEMLFVEADRAKGFNMNGDLMRFALMKIDREIYRFIWTFHHALFDGWSGPLVLRDVLCVYHSKELSPAPSFRLFVDFCKNHDMSVSQNFWSDYLDNLLPKRFLSLKNLKIVKNSNQQDDRDVMRTFSLQIGDLKQFARRNFLTTTSVMYGAWALILDRYCSTFGTDVVFAVVMASRSAEVEGIEDMVGLLLNTLPLRIPIPSDESVTLIDWLTDIQARQAAIMAYDHSNLADIRKWSGLPRDQNLFDTLVTYENYPTLDNVADPEIEMTDIQGYERVQFPLGVLFADDGENLMAKCMYDANLISDDFALQLLTHLDNALDEILHSDNMRSVINIDIVQSIDTNSSYKDTFEHVYRIKDHRGRECPIGVPGKLFIHQSDENEFFSGVVAQTNRSGETIIMADKECDTCPEELRDIDELNECFIAENEKMRCVFVSPRLNINSFILEKIKTMCQRDNTYPIVLPVDEIKACDKKVMNDILQTASNLPSKLHKPAWQEYSKIKEELTDKEVILRDMWATLLGMKVDDIKLDHSFFDLGGTSIKAISLVSLGEKKGLIFNLGDVLQFETLVDIAAVAQLKNDDGDMLVCLNDGEEDKMPVICVHASDGGTSSYAYVAGHLKRHPVYAFRFLEGTTPFESVSQLADIYVNRMKKLSFFNLSTPYTLVGYSSGCVIAFEMAIKLEQVNRTPETLVLLDGTPEFVTNTYKKIQGSSEEQLSNFEQWFEDTWKEKGLNEEDLKTGLSTFRGNLKNYASYSPSAIYNENVIFVRATELLTDGPLAEALAEIQAHGCDYGSQRLCSKPVRVVEVDGDHYTMMRDPKKIIATAIVGNLH